MAQLLRGWSILLAPGDEGAAKCRHALEALGARVCVHAADVPVTHVLASTVEAADAARARTDAACAISLSPWYAWYTLQAAEALETPPAARARALFAPWPACARAERPLHGGVCVVCGCVRGRIARAYVRALLRALGARVGSRREPDALTHLVYAGALATSPPPDAARGLRAACAGRPALLSTFGVEQLAYAWLAAYAPRPQPLSAERPRTPPPPPQPASAEEEPRTPPTDAPRRAPTPTAAPAAAAAAARSPPANAPRARTPEQSPHAPAADDGDGARARSPAAARAAGRAPAARVERSASSAGSSPTAAPPPLLGRRRRAPSAIYISGCNEAKRAKLLESIGQLRSLPEGAAALEAGLAAEGAAGQAARLPSHLVMHAANLKRSENFLVALAGGSWLLRRSWLDQSAREGSWADESEHELLRGGGQPQQPAGGAESLVPLGKGTLWTGASAFHRALHASARVGCFAGVRALVCAGTRPPPLAMVRILHAAGARAALARSAAAEAGVPFEPPPPGSSSAAGSADGGRARPSARRGGLPALLLVVADRAEAATADAPDEDALRRAEGVGSEHAIARVSELLDRICMPHLYFEREA